jgi:hypothetical protein
VPLASSVEGTPLGFSLIVLSLIGFSLIGFSLSGFSPNGLRLPQ